MKNKLFRIIGAYFLKWSGLNVPKKLLHEVMTPMEVVKTYSFGDGIPANYQDQLFIQAQGQVMDHAKSYMNSRIVKKGDQTHVELVLLIQRPSI